MKIYRILFLLLLTLIIPNVVLAANHYVRAGATGASNGSDWTNAYTNLPATLVRGDTYYIAGGSYGSYAFDDAVSGATPIYIKKATVANHGSVTGWDNSYGIGPATFTAWKITTDYWDIDGQVGNLADWLPGYEAYGFRVSSLGTTGSKLIWLQDNSGARPDYVTLSHIEAFYTNTSTWYTSMDIVYGYGNNQTFDHMWLHDAGRTCMIFTASANIIVQNSVMERSGQGQHVMNWGTSEHSETVSLNFTNGMTIRNSYFRDWESTGCIMMRDEGDCAFYGNVFTQTGTYTDQPSDGVINGFGTQLAGNVVVYNNTFANLEFGCYILNMLTATSKTVKNNIFYNSNYQPSTPGCTISGSHDYNWFYNSGAQSEAHIQNGIGNPFVAESRWDFRLAAGATNAGDNTIGSGYNKDMVGNIRGGDGIWDRGAFESGGVLPLPRPSSPSSLTVQ